MSDQSLKPLLEKHPFFAGLDDAYLDLLAGCGANKRFKPGEYLMREDDPADHFFVLRKGHVAIKTDAVERGELTIQTAGEGDVLGWSWLIAPYRSRFNVQAVEDTVTTALDGRCLRGKCEADPALGYALLQRFSAMLAQRLEQTRSQLLDVYGRPQ